MNVKPSLLRIVSIVISVVGLIVLLRSTNIGMDNAQEILTSRGGMNTDEYRLLQTNYIETYRWLGIILLGIGLLYSLRPLENDEKTEMKKHDNNGI